MCCLAGGSNISSFFLKTMWWKAWVWVGIRVCVSSRRSIMFGWWSCSCFRNRGPKSYTRLSRRPFPRVMSSPLRPTVRVRRTVELFCPNTRSSRGRSLVVNYWHLGMLWGQEKSSRKPIAMFCFVGFGCRSVRVWRGSSPASCYHLMQIASQVCLQSRHIGSSTWNIFPPRW
jgi:hypothetical protein